MTNLQRAMLGAALTALVSACGGGSGASGTGTDPTGGCSGSCQNAGVSLTVADVERVIAQAVFEAQARSTPMTIAVVDRVGNVLAVYRLGSPTGRTITIATRLDANGNAVITAGLEGISVQADQVGLDLLAAIAKAVTGAYLSSEGNAFSTRTASQIVQQNFNPGENNQPAGPLFGVQFSQLACSDFIRNFNGVGPDAGPHRSPLGLSADPGGFPLYKNGTAVGGVGVLANDLYTVDPDISDSDNDLDELIATAATFGFSAPLDRRGDRITVDGKTFRFSDVDFDDLSSRPADAPSFSSIPPASGTLIAVPGYSTGAIQAGTAFGLAASGIRPDGDVNYPGTDAFVFVDETDALRFPPRAGTDATTTGPAVLTANEVRTVLRNALQVADRARAQIRRPLDSSARVTISIVDTQGEILAMARTRDAPMFGSDVSLQKARTAMLFSTAGMADFVRGLPDAQYALTTGASVSFADYIDAAQTFFGDPNAFEDGVIAYAARSVGSITRPFYPDGIETAPPGPFSKPRGEWSPFSTGLQLDLANNAILRHVGFIGGLFPSDVVKNCAGVDLATGTSAVTTRTVANGLQIFAGGVPIYRDNVLVGGIGVSGDGVDQDDMIAFLGLFNGARELGTLNNAPIGRRADTLSALGSRLRYIQCPQAPFVGSSEDNVCANK